MKFSAQEEYGLRCLLRIAYSKSPNGLTIPEISNLEGITQSNAAKLLRILRLGGFIDSARGQSGGYKLTRSPEKIIVSDVLEVLGGKLFQSSFCDIHSGAEMICTNSIDCSIRSLWKAVQVSVDGILKKTTIKDLIGNEEAVNMLVRKFTEENLVMVSK
jgi:Rrf2 family protein